MTTAQSMRELESRGENFNFGAFFDILVLYRRMMGWIFAVFAFCGIAWAVLADPPFQADILVQIEENGTATAARSMLGDLTSMFDVKSTADSEMYVIGSRLVVTKAVDDLKLYIEAAPARFPLIGSAVSRGSSKLSKPGLLGIGGYAWGAERLIVTRFDVPGSFEDAKYALTLREGGAYSIDGPGLDAEAIGKIGEPFTFKTAEGPISIDIESIYAKPGTRFNLVRHSREATVEALQRELRISQEGKDTDILRVKLRGADAYIVTNTMNQVARAYVEQNVARKAEDAQRSLDFLQSQLPELRQKLDESETTLTDLRSRLGSVDINGEAKMVLDQAAQIDAQRLQLQQQRAELASRFSDKYRTVVALDQQIALLDSKAGAFNKRIDRLPGVQREIVRAERDVKVNNDLYVGLLNNVEQLSLLRAGQIGNVRIIDYATVADRPVRLWRVTVVAIALLIGAFIAVGAAYLRDLLFGGVSDARDIEEHAGLRVFSMIPLAEAQRGSIRLRGAGRTTRSIMALSHPTDPAIEALRSLRTAMQFSMMDANNNIVMFAGATPGIGKSFVSTNVAAVLASTGKRVLLVDADLRRGRLGDWYAGGARPGLSDVLTSTADVKTAIRRTGHENLHLLPCGSRPDSAADLLHEPATRTLFSELAKQYDIIVVDTAPILPVPDTLALAPLASGNLFLVARAAMTKVGELDETKRRLSQVGVEVTGVVLNGVDPRSGRLRYGLKYGSYHYASYDYSGIPQGDAEQGRS